MSNSTFRRVYDLGKLKHWINALNLYSMPINEILQDKLNQMIKNRDLDEITYRAIVNWKKSKEIHGNDENDCKLFLKHLKVIEERYMEEFEFSLPLGGDGPSVKFIKNHHPKMYFLSLNYGQNLSNYLKMGSNDLYELTLFWLILRCKKYMPLLQKTIFNPKAYNGDIKDLIPTMDSISRNCLLKWGEYFNFIKRGGNEYKLMPKRLAKLFISSTILELNEIREREIKIKKLVDILSNNFRINTTTIDFTRILEVIFNHTSRSILSGFTTGRDDIGLPSNRNIQILKFKSALPLGIIQSISDVDAYGILRYWRG